MENYARALGIKGWKNWDMTWEKPCRGGERLSLEELNQYRQWMLEPLKVLRQAFKEEKMPDHFFCYHGFAPGP